jgi:hypothetical protein
MTTGGDADPAIDIAPVTTGIPPVPRDEGRWAPGDAILFGGVTIPSGCAQGSTVGPTVGVVAPVLVGVVVPVLVGVIVRVLVPAVVPGNRR